MLFTEKEVFIMMIALEENKFIWSNREVASFRKMWNRGDNIGFIAKCLKCNKTDVVLLVIDQAEKGEIKPRKDGIY